MSASFALQQAVYGAVFSAVSPTKVYDNPPPNMDKFPYVAFDGWDASDWGDKTAPDDEEHVFDVSVFSRYRGQKEVKQLLAKIKGALHRQPLTVAGFTLVEIIQESEEVTLDGDGLTFYGAARFRAWTAAAP